MILTSKQVNTVKHQPKLALVFQIQVVKSFDTTDKYFYFKIMF